MVTYLALNFTPYPNQTNRRERHLPAISAPIDLLKGSRIMVNTAFGLEYPQPVSPLAEYTGPFLPSSYMNGQVPELPMVVRTWLEVSI